MFQGLSNVDFTRSLGALGSDMSADAIYSIMRPVLKDGLIYKIKDDSLRNVITQLLSGFRVTNSVSEGDIDKATGDSVKAAVQDIILNNWGYDTAFAFQSEIRAATDQIKAQGYYVVPKGWSPTSSTSSAAPSKSWWDAITVPAGIPSAPIRQTQGSVVQSKRPAVDAAAIARQYAQNHPSANVWTARMPWIIGGIGLVLVVSIALLIGTNDN